MPNHVVASDLLDTGPSADYLGVRKQTMECWRCQNRGPRYIKVGRRVKYRRADLDAFLHHNTIVPGAEPGQD